MPLPTSYTESALLGFMESTLGPIGTDLGIEDTDLLVEAAYEVAGLLGHDVSAETDVMKVRVLARWQAWLAARRAAAGQTDLKAGSAGLTRSQVWTHIDAELALASMAAAVYPEGASALSGGQAVLTTISDRSPYGPAVCSEWG